MLKFFVLFGDFCHTTVCRSQQVRCGQQKATEETAGCSAEDSPATPRGILEKLWDNSMENKPSEARGNLQWFMNKRCQNVLCTAKSISNVHSRHCPATGTVVNHHIKPVMSLIFTGHMLGNRP